MFGRATIRLGIGPHSSLDLGFLFLCFLLFCSWVVYSFALVIVLGIVFSAVSQTNSWEERL